MEFDRSVRAFVLKPCLHIRFLHRFSSCYFLAKGDGMGAEPILVRFTHPHRLLCNPKKRAEKRD